MIKSRPITPSNVESKDPRCLAINHAEIPCTIEQMRKNGKAIPVKFTILKPLSAGFGAAPFSMATKDKKDPNARKYSQLVYKGSECVLRMYPFEKTAVLGDKGPLIERPFTIECGNTVTLFLDVKKLKEDSTRDKPCLPHNTVSVPQFTLCEITLAPKSHEAEEKGSCIKVTMVRIAPYSLYSLWNVFPQLPITLQDARVAQMEHVAIFPNIHKDIETRDVPFIIQLSSQAQIDETGAEPMLLNWGGSEPIVLSRQTLLRYTNTTRLDWAIALLNVAIACESVKVIVFSNDFWTKDGSVYKGIPMIDTEHLLEPVEPGASVETRYSTVVDDEKYRINIVVEKDIVTVQEGPEPSAPDFVLAGLKTELAQAYPITFNLVNDKGMIPAIWKGYVNARREDGLKRKRFSSMMD